MRIVTVLTSLGMGGAEKLALAVSERMAGRGHTVAVLALKARLEEEWPTVLPVVHLDVRKTTASAAAGMWRGRGFLRQFRPDVVHSHSFHANIFARGLTLLAPIPAVISNIHNVNEGGSMRMLAYRLTDRLAQRTVAVSEAARLRFVELKAASAQKSGVFPIGIDVSAFAPDPRRRVRTRAEMGTATNPGAEFIWLAVGRITVAKDYPNLIDAFAQLRRQQDNARLWIVGEAASAKAAEIKALCADSGAGQTVRWLGLRRDLPALLDAADGFVQASAWEGMPQSVAEAMAMEKPVVATGVGGVRELMGDTGTIVPPKNPGALARAMMAEMKPSGEVRAQLVRAARERVVSLFSIDAAANAWETLYKQLTADG